MIKEQIFSIHDFENIDIQNYQSRTINSNIFHSLEWMKAIKESLGIKYKIATLTENDKVVASIPFVTYRNFIKGPCALPMHFSGFYDSIVSDNDFVKKKILSQFYEYCINHKFYTHVPEVAEIKGYQSFSGYSIYKMNLEPGTSAEKQMLARATPRRSKEMTKNLDKCDLEIYTGGLNFLDKFYFLYLQNMKELGSPPFPKIYFKKIIENFSDYAKIILVNNKKQFCSSALILRVSATELFTPVICTPRLYKSGRSSHLIYMQAAKEAQKLGCSVMNFGRSIDGGGPALFKQRYGLKAIPLLIYSPYQNWTVTNPQESFLRYAVAIWKILPIFLTKLFGKIFSKHVI